MRYVLCSLGRREPDCGPGGGVRLLLLLLLLCLAGCTDLQVSERGEDSAAVLAGRSSFRFARAPLAGEPGVSAAAVLADQAARSAISRALTRRGLHESEATGASSLVVDFSLRDAVVANLRGPDGPSDYRRSWRTGGPADGTGSMDHTVADSALRRELALTVLLRSDGTDTARWEGTVSRSVAPDYPDRDLGRLLQSLCERLFQSSR